ncbi:uncharacterized protein ATC70_001727 [Mucor velutinosus]|uniref:Uncharacterized protein n=1 Tax=Mucor velutinosus TaxID=708070 RepID=A0AAN7HP29_9FUNG|nr:hypothetical protein ATC70_001727 [Mucor velutinosus]
MSRLAEFLYIKIFAGEEEDPRLFCAMAVLLGNWDSWSRENYTGDFDDSAWWPNLLNENIKSRLYLITFGGIMQLLDDDIDIRSIESKAEQYLQRYDDEETAQSIAVVEEDDDEEPVIMEINPYRGHNLFFTEKHCQKLYLPRVTKPLVWFLESRCEANSNCSNKPKGH